MNERELKRLREAEDARQREIEAGVIKLFNKWTRRICITVTIWILWSAADAGKWAVFNSDRVYRAIAILLGDGK